MALSGLSSRAIQGMFYEELSQDLGGQVLAALSGAPFTSDQLSESYAWIGQVPQMREWLGGRQAKGFNDQSWSVVNKHYEGTIEIGVSDARRDKTPQVRLRIGELASRANAHWMQLVMALVAAGESAACYDGQYFYDTDHSEGSSGTQDNDITTDISALPVSDHGTTSRPSIGEMRECILKSAETILAFKDDRGEYVNEMMRDFLVVVPTTLWSPAAGAVAQDFSNRGETNVMGVLDGYTFQVATSPRLNGWTDRFPVFATGGRQKAIIRQEETPLMLKSKAEGSEYEFDNDAWQFGVDSWRAAAYGDWKKTCLNKMT